MLAPLLQTSYSCSPQTLHSPFCAIMDIGNGYSKPITMGLEDLMLNEITHIGSLGEWLYSVHSICGLSGKLRVTDCTELCISNRDTDTGSHDMAF